jgi:hypothetical protein
MSYYSNIRATFHISNIRTEYTISNTATATHCGDDDDYDFIPFPKPPLEWSSYIHNTSDLARKFLYYGLAPSTRKTYPSYQKSYENFCLGRDIQPYPAQKEVLVEWISLRAFGSADIGQEPLKADSLAQALSVVKSVHIDQRLPFSAFNSEYISRTLVGIRRIQSKVDKKKAKPLSMDQLEQITSPALVILNNNSNGWSEDPKDCTLSLSEINKLNEDTALKIAFAGFSRTKEITYEDSDLENKAVFEYTKLQRRDVTFADNYKHAIVNLRDSKCDYDHIGVEVVIATQVRLHAL